jgi:hypothetical protein
MLAANNPQMPIVRRTRATPSRRTNKKPKPVAATSNKKLLGEKNSHRSFDAMKYNELHPLDRNC